MSVAPEVDEFDAAFLARQRAVLREERDAQEGVVEAFDAEANSLVRRREAGGPAEEGFGRGETTSVELQHVRAEHRAAVAHLADIDAALGRLDSGRYGSCEACRRPIGRARLEAIPTASRCVTCQAARRPR